MTREDELALHAEAHELYAKYHVRWYHGDPSADEAKARWDEIMAVLLPIADATIKAAFDRATPEEIAKLEALLDARRPK